MDVNITINVDGAGEVEIEKNDEQDAKIENRRTKHGFESILKLPDSTTQMNRTKPILDFMGV